MDQVIVTSSNYMVRFYVFFRTINYCQHKLPMVKLEIKKYSFIGHIPIGPTHVVIYIINNIAGNKECRQ